MLFFSAAFFSAFLAVLLVILLVFLLGEQLLRQRGKVLSAQRVHDGRGGEVVPQGGIDVGRGRTAVEVLNGFTARKGVLLDVGGGAVDGDGAQRFAARKGTSRDGIDVASQAHRGERGQHSKRNGRFLLFIFSVLFLVVNDFQSHPRHTIGGAVMDHDGRNDQRLGLCLARFGSEARSTDAVVVSDHIVHPVGDKFLAAARQAC